MSIKALAVAVLQGNRQGNQRETKSFLPGKLRKLEQTPRKLDGRIPNYQHDLCIAHADFNKWRGHCPCSLDKCLVTKVIDSAGDINKLMGLEIGRGIATDQVITEWVKSGEPVKDIYKNPAWLVCIAEHLMKRIEQ